jgi:hypothetical protein
MVGRFSLDHPAARSIDGKRPVQRTPFVPALLVTFRHVLLLFMLRLVLTATNRRSPLEQKSVAVEKTRGREI